MKPKLPKRHNCYLSVRVIESHRRHPGEQKKERPRRADVTPGTAWWACGDKAGTLTDEDGRKTDCIYLSAHTALPEICGDVIQPHQTEIDAFCAQIQTKFLINWEKGKGEACFAEHSVSLISRLTCSASALECLRRASSLISHRIFQQLHFGVMTSLERRMGIIY